MIAGRRQEGLTLVEVLVGLVVGIIVIGGATVLYVSSVRGGNDALLSSKLNQEVGALMTVMGNDIRRAGFWGAAMGGRPDQNPFNLPGETALIVRDDMNANLVQPPTGQGSCIAYTYDATYDPANASGVVEANDLFGFRLNGTVVQMRQSGVVDGAACVGGTCTSCANGVWQDVTDPAQIEITGLNFDLANSQCLNAAEPNDADDNGDGTIDGIAELDCYVTIPTIGSGNITLETREVTISVTGRLTGDPTVQASATQSVRVRNATLRIW